MSASSMCSDAAVRVFIAHTVVWPLFGAGELDGLRTGVGTAPGYAGDTRMSGRAGAGARSAAGSRGARGPAERLSAGGAWHVGESLYLRTGDSAL